MITQFTGAMSIDDMQQWNSRQVYIALGQLMTSAAVMGVDSCPLEGISAAAYDQILSLDGSGYRTLVACALGYRSEHDKYATAPKARFPLEKVVSVIA
jgi:nitroreductase